MVVTMTIDKRAIFMEEAIFIKYLVTTGTLTVCNNWNTKH